MDCVDGMGCGAFGFRGTYERAITKLRNNTLNMGGDYAQLITLTEPYRSQGCFHNEMNKRDE